MILGLEKRVTYYLGKYKTIVPWVGLFIMLYFIGTYLPEGFDWKMYFAKGLVHPVWTPWTAAILRFLNYPLVVAITLFSIILRAYRYNKSPYPIALAIISLPTLWVLFMGNLDGIVLLGLLFLPWGAPLSLMKPQVSAFALLAKNKYILAGMIWLIISLIIWGLWPLNFLMVFTPEWEAEWTQDISLFPWGLLIALPLMWFSRRDEDMLMAAGSFATPHLFPYHFILLMPALARMKPLWMILSWAISWTPLLANYLGPNAWHFGNLLGLCIWCGIKISTHQPRKGKALPVKETTAGVGDGMPQDTGMRKHNR